MFKKLKRRRELKTDYHQRLALLKSGLPRLVVRKSLRYILAQIVEYDPKGDKVLFSVLSKKLRDFGWNFSFANTPAAYLTGLIVGYEALKRGVKKAVLDIGLQRSTKGNRIYALVKGCLDAGLEVPCSEAVIPSEERIRGEHIANFARMLKENDPQKFKRQFSRYLKLNLDPCELPSVFESVRQKIIAHYKGEKDE